MSPRRVLRRLAAIVTLLMIGPGSYASAACNGWSGSAAERMACCQAAAGHCASISADDCCADAEQRRNAEPGAVAVAIAPARQPGDILRIPAPVRAPAELAHRTAPGRPDTYLLDSVFLI